MPFEIPDLKRKIVCFAKNGIAMMAAGARSNFVFWKQRSEIAFSDLPIKKQIGFGQIWKRLVMIAVDLNQYELLNGPKSPFLGVCPELPWRPPNPLMLLNCFPIVSLIHMIVWRHLLFGKCEILRMAAHFSPSCLGLMGNLGNPLALFFDYNLPIFFAQEGYWRSNLLISRWR